MAITDYDAEVCYDQIIPSVCTFIEHKAELPKNVSILCVKTLQQMKYFPVTAKRISKIFNQHNDNEPVLGSGQGTTESPAKWTGTSNAIIKCYNKWAIGQVITTLKKIIQRKCNNAMFIDDSTLFHNLSNIFELSCIVLMGIVKYDVTLWGRYLWTLDKWLEYMKT
eukprot:7124156-Ditylum_brightwellii.AAC.1